MRRTPGSPEGLSPLDRTVPVHRTASQTDARSRVQTTDRHQRPLGQLGRVVGPRARAADRAGLGVGESDSHQPSYRDPAGHAPWLASTGDSTTFTSSLDEGHMASRHRSASAAGVRQLDGRHTGIQNTAHLIDVRAAERTATTDLCPIPSGDSDPDRSSTSPVRCAQHPSTSGGVGGMSQGHAL